MSRRWNTVVAVLAAVMLGFGTMPAFCQEDDAGPGLTGPREMHPMEMEAFGSGYQTLVIPAAEFTPQGDATCGYAGRGYIYRTGGTETVFWAPVMLPAGAFVGLSALYLYDDSPTADITVSFGAYGFPISGTPYYHPFQAITKDTDVGYTYQLFAPNATIRYYADLDDNGSTEATAYRLAVYLPATDSSLRFGAVELNWMRTISPEPATATFDDVQPGDFGFKHVEALSASGITAGCDATHFCPDAPLTRVQMAVFLAKALGLHWGS